MRSSTRMTLWADRFRSTSMARTCRLKVVHHVESPEAASTEQAVAHETHGPAEEISGCWHGQGFRISGWKPLLAPSVYIQVERTIKPLHPFLVPVMALHAPEFGRS